MIYMEYVERRDSDFAAREIITLAEAEEMIVNRYSQTKEFPELAQHYKDEYGSNLIEDLEKAKSVDDDYYGEILKRAFELAEFDVCIKSEPEHNTELDTF